MDQFQKKLLREFGITALFLGILAVTLALIAGDISKLEKQITTIKGDYSARTQALTNLNGLKLDAKKALGGLSFLQNTLPYKEGLFIFSEDMSRIAREKSLAPSFIFGTETPGSDSIPGRIMFTMTVSGDQGKILEFIRAMESSRYFTRIQGVELVSQGVNTVDYQGIITGEVFFRSK